MKTFPELLSLARLGSENVDYSDSTGIQDDEIYQHLTDAVRRLESVIFVRHPKAFLKQKVIAIGANVEMVYIPSDCYMKNRFLLVEWSNSSDERGFYTLKKGNLQERYTGSKGHPIYYIPIGEKFILKPSTNNGGFVRLVYQLAQPAADTKRGVIASGGLTVNSTTRTISGITLDAASTSTPLDSTSINTKQFLTVVDRYGVTKVKDLEIVEVDPLSGVLSLYGGSHVYDTDESIAEGDFVCLGGYSSFKSTFTNNCERYILQYAIWKMQKRDSNVDNGEAIIELQQLEADIIASYSEPDSDVDYVSIIDSQYIGTDYDQGLY